MEQQPRQEMTLNEAVESLNGFDEIAIEKRFGGDITSLLTNHAIRAVRATVFVLRRRDGLKDDEAYKASMEMSIREAQDYFPDEPDEIMPDEPVTEVGKDSSEPAAPLTSSPPSVS